MTREATLQMMLRVPAQLGRWCGYPLLTDKLHGQWIRDMIGGRGDMTLLAHRGSYKTTCLALAMAIMMCVRPAQSILFMRKTDDDAAEILRQVRKIIGTDAMMYLTAQLYGQPVGFERATTDTLTASCYCAPRGSGQLTCCGVNGTLTGKHADVIFTDDIVTLRDRVSYPERERTKGVYMELQNVRNPGGRLVNIGTPWHRDDAISLMPNVKRYSCYDTGLLTRSQISALRESMAPSLFAANYELRHIANDSALFGQAPTFTNDLSKLYNGIAHIDASYGGDDFTALTCGRREGDTIYLYGRIWPKHIDAVAQECLGTVEQHLCGPVWCEMNGDKGYLARELRSMGAEVRTYHEHTGKHVKIATYLRKWWKQIVFLEGTDPDYIAQILDYSETAAHDDAPDSAACVCRLLDQQPRRFTT